MNQRQSKILGSLLAASVADAMGCCTENGSIETIQNYFGGYCEDVVDMPEGSFPHGGSEKGVVTDDFSISYYSLEEFLKDGGVTEEGAKRAVIRWFEEPNSKYIRYAGPTSRAAYNRLKGIPMPHTKQDNLVTRNREASNGAAMKVGCVGLLNAGNVDKAIDDAITMCKVTHDNAIALSGACAIAASTAKAMEDRVSWIEVVQAGFYGAKEGYRRSFETAFPTCGAMVERRMEYAIDLGMEYQDNFDLAMQELSKRIGTGLPANEAVPAAYGMITATKGDAWKTILMAVNAGDDTDTVGCMAGYIVGALEGAEAVSSYLDLINEKNHFDLEKMALQIDAMLG
ncbi:MAG: ADP-ribosylglycohydrolase family protein [Solobacterium sp.]|nr:ADP-ribosylglycohydrolase family protein [Solobacterium sp.]